MDIVVFSRSELNIALRALRDVASDNGVFSEAERDFIVAVGHLHGTVVDPDALAPISREEIVAGIVDPHARKRLVQLALILALVEGELDEETPEFIRSLAGDLAIEDGGLEVLEEVANGDLMFARLDMVRRLRANMAAGITLPKALKMLLPTLGIPNDALAARYVALGDCAPGTFGRAFFDHYRNHGFALPGEKRSVPERMTFHDAGHVLSGYDIDPAGEIQQAAFQAGFMRRDGFAVLLFGILQFHMGLRITPVARAERGYFDVKKVLAAAQRGASCKVDLSADWDLFAVKDVPLESLRASYGVPPIAA